MSGPERVLGQAPVQALGLVQERAWEPAQALVSGQAQVMGQARVRVQAQAQALGSLPNAVGVQHHPRRNR